MTNTKSIKILLAAIAALTAAHVFLSVNGGAEKALVHRQTMLEIPISQVSRIDVVRDGALAMALGRLGGWRIVEPFAAVVDERSIKRLLDALASCEVAPRDSMTASELKKLKLTWRDLSLDKPALRITVAGDGVSETVSFGRASPDGRSVYMAVGDENVAYAVPTSVLETVDISTRELRSRDAFAVGPESVTSFSVKQGAGSFARFSREQGAWRMVEPQDAAASGERVGEFLNAITAVSAKDFLWPVGATGEVAVATASMLSGYGLDSESAVTVTLKCSDGTDRQVSFGSGAKDGLAYALIQNSGALVTVDGAAADMARRDLAGFIDTRLFPQGTDGAANISIAADGAKYLLEKGADGSWTLDAPVVAATDQRSVATLLSRIAELRVGDIVAGEDGVAVAISSNTPPVTVSRNSVLKGFRLSDLRSREIVNIDPLVVKRVSVKAEGQETATSVCYDRDRREWTVESAPKGGMADAAAIDDALRAVHPLKAEWIVKLKVTSADLKAYGLETPRLTVAIDTVGENAVRRNILIGKGAQGGHFVTLGASDAVFVISDAAVRRLSAPLVTK